MTIKQGSNTAVPLMLVLILAQFVFGQSVLADEKADFTLPDMDGREHSLSDYRGKWVLVNYWATWCPPCREELPELEVLHSQSEGKTVVLGVNMEDINIKPLRTFVEEQFLSFPILLAGARPSSEQLLGQIPGMPTSFLISPEGEIVARQVGTLTAEVVRKFIKSFEADS